MSVYTPTSDENDPGVGFDAQTLTNLGCNGGGDPEEECGACVSAAKIFREAILRARILDP
jgi:hypothetical protein